ncbi:hypothetical protein C8R42DRAFT_447564 [Lentinula raphanica]|nr:hypothetical protein C8R42DRAFT_447564 [Lentinula raphanica]
MKFYAVTSFLLLFMISATTVQANFLWTARNQQDACGHLHQGAKGIFTGGKMGSKCEFKPKGNPVPLEGTCKMQPGAEHLLCSPTGGTTAQTSLTAGMSGAGATGMGTTGTGEGGMGSTGTMDTSGAGMPSGAGTSDSGAYRRRKRASFSRRTV